MTLDLKLNNIDTHQSKWKDSVFKVYEKTINLDWTNKLIKECKKVKIDFLPAYSFELVDYINRFVPAYKAGSGDITWHDIIIIWQKNKTYNY